MSDNEAAKRARGRGGAAGGTGRGRGRRVNATSNNIMDEDESSLFALVKNGKASIREVVDNWMEEYGRSPDEALVRLLQFFISASGCKGVITLALFHKQDYKEMVNVMSNEFDEDSAEYPLLGVGPVLKKFPERMGTFIHTLMDKCKEEMIFDENMMHNVISFLISAADSEIRALRHTATHGALSVITGLVKVSKILLCRREIVNRQHDTELVKSQGKRGGNRLEMIIEQRQNIDEKMSEIKLMYAYLFKSVFTHRYRDTVWEIRSLCVHELGIWMKELKNEFLEDSFLKYIGWTIHDKKEEVRRQCLDAILPLYEDPDLTQRLELFITKFKERLLSMVLDVDNECAVKTIKLLTAILRTNADYLEGYENDRVYESVYSQHKGIGVAAGKFLTQKLFANEPNDESGVTKRGKARSPSTPLIHLLLGFYSDAQSTHTHATYLVDSLIDSNDWLKDYEAFTDLLLEEPGKDEIPLSDVDELRLIEIMVCVIKQGTTGESPRMISHGKGGHHVAASSNGNQRKDKGEHAKELKEEKAKMTAHFIPLLPALLQKYVSDVRKLQNLLLIPTFFDLELYTTMRQEKSLDQLLKRMEDIVDRHSEKEIMEVIGEVYSNLTNEQLPIAMRCATWKHKLIDTIVLKLKEQLRIYGQELTHLVLSCKTRCLLPESDAPAARTSPKLFVWLDKSGSSSGSSSSGDRSVLGREEALDDKDEDEVVAVLHSLKKITAFHIQHDLTQWDLWELVFPLVPPPENVGEDASDALQKAINGVRDTAMGFCFLYISWALVFLTSTQAPDQGVIDRVKRRRDEFLVLLPDVIVDDDQTIRHNAFLILCDILILYGPNLGRKSDPETGAGGGLGEGTLVDLSLPEEDPILHRLSDFVEDNVFKHEEADRVGNDMEDNERSILDVQQRRIMLASFCKLVSFNVPRMKYAAHIFKYYLKCKYDYGDILKATLQRCRERSKIDCARLVNYTLRSLFEELKGENDSVEPGVTEGWAGLEGLAKRLALSFGPDAVRNREAIANLHREGILYALGVGQGPIPSNELPPNLAYLEILQEFTHKLIPNDKMAIVRYLDKHLQSQVGDGMGEGEAWQPYVLYRNSLTSQQNNPAADQSNASLTGGRGRGPGKPPAARIATPTPSEGEGNDIDNEEDEGGHRNPSSRAVNTNNRPRRRQNRSRKRNLSESSVASLPAVSTTVNNKNQQSRIRNNSGFVRHKNGIVARPQRRKRAASESSAHSSVAGSCQNNSVIEEEDEGEIDDGIQAGGKAGPTTSTPMVNIDSTSRKRKLGRLLNRIPEFDEESTIMMTPATPASNHRAILSEMLETLANSDVVQGGEQADDSIANENSAATKSPKKKHSRQFSSNPRQSSANDIASDENRSTSTQPFQPIQDEQIIKRSSRASSRQRNQRGGSQKQTQKQDISFVPETQSSSEQIDSLREEYC